MIYIDTHCHLDFPEFAADRNQILDRCTQHNIAQMIIPGVVETNWGELIQLCGQTSLLKPALGLHPCFLDNVTPESLKKLETQVKGTSDIVAIGETGLDYFIKDPDKDKQNHYFQQQIKIAQKHHLPLILHVRKAHDEVIKTLKNHKFDVGGVVHCYSGSLQQAEHFLQLNFKLGISGVITYDRSRRLQKIVSALPLTSFVIETDAPDIPPLGKERQRNSPEYIPQIFNAFSSYRKESKTEIAQTLIQNTLEIFPKLGISIERLS